MTEVVAENAIMLSRKDGAGNNMGSQPSQPAPAAPQDDVSIPSPEQIPTINVDDDKDEIKVEDIPF